MTDKTKSNQTTGRGFRLPSAGTNNAGGNAFSARGGVNANNQTGTATGQKAATPKQSSGPAVRLSDYSGTKGYNAAKTLVSQKKTATKPARANSWQYNADGSKKKFDQLTTGEVFAWINTLPESERGSTAARFENEYLKNPGSTRYDPYYTNFSNNDEARALFGVDVFDREWIDANRGYLSGVTFTDENYTTPKKPGKYASDEEKKAYAYWQIANTYEETTRNAEAEYEQLRKDIQEQVAAFKGDGTHSLTGDTLTADEVLDSIDWKDYKTLQNMREASYAGNGRYLNRPVKVGDASLRAMVNAALRGEDVTQDRDFLWDESQRLTNEEPVEAVAKAAPVSWAKTFAGAKELALGSMDERAENLAKRIEKDAKAQAKDNEKERKEEAEDRPSFLSGGAEETDLAARIREIKARAGLTAEEPQAPAEAAATPEPTPAPMGSNRPTATPEAAATPAPTATMSQSAQDMMGVRDAEIEQLAETAAQAEEDSDEQQDIIDRLTAMIDERETISRKNAAAGNLLAGRRSAQEAVRAVQESKAERARQAVVQRQLDEQVTEAYGTTEIEETAPVEYNEFIGSMRATSSLDATYGYVRHAIESIDTTSLEGLTNTERVNLERLRGEYAEQLELLKDERAARREIEDRVMEGLENIGVGQGWGIGQYLWNQGRLDAIRDGDKVPLDDYEKYLRYRLMPGVSTAEGTVKPYAEMQAYDRYGMIESAVGYAVAGAMDGFQKGASALSRGLEELLYYAKHKMHPEMTREELYATDRDLADIRAWNSMFEKDIIPDNVEAVADAQHPALAMMGDVLGEVVKMSTQGVAAGGIADALGGMPIVNRLITATSENGFIRSIGLQNAPFFADVFANTVDQARMEGANDDEAFMAGLLTSVISGPLSSYSVDKLGNLGGRLKGLLGKAGRTAAQQGAIRAGKEGMGTAILTLIKTMGKSFASEGLEEALEEPIQSGIAKAVYDEDRAWTGEGGVFDWKAMGASGLMGGLTGSMYSVLGGLSGMLGKPAQTQAERILEKVLDGEVVTLVEQEQIGKTMDQLTGLANRAAAIEDRTADLMMEGESPEVTEAESKLQAAAESVAGLEEQQAAAQKAFDEAAARYQGIKDQFNAGTLQYTDADRAQAALDEAVKQLPALKKDLDKANQQLEDARAKQQEADKAYNAAVETWAAQLREQAAAEVDSEIAQENVEAQAPAEVSRGTNTTGEAETFAEANNAEAQTETKAETQMDGDLPAAKKPGVNRMFSRVLNSAQERQLQILDALGRRYGLQFDVMDDIEGANASYAGGRTISVSLNAVDQAYVQAGVHEMVHYVKRASSDGYALLEATVLSELSKNEAFDLEAAISARIEEYKGTQTLNREGAIEEIVAEAIPTLFADENAVRQLVQTDRNLAQKIRDFFVEFARELRRIALGYGADSDHMEVVASIANADAGVDTLMEYAAVLDDALEMARSEMAAETDGGQFSLKNIFERVRDLTAVHNLRPEALIEALKMGGMPAPSIAVVKAKDGHSMYGPISLMFKSDSIDPRRDERNHVYGSDAWTPTRDTAAASLTDGEATAEDIVRAMYESGVRKGVDYEGYQTEGLIAASAAKEYGSIRDIRRDKGRLGMVPDGEYAERWKQLGENVQGLLSTAYKASRQAGSGVGIVDVANAMADAAREGARKPTEIADFFADRGIPIDNETARKISDAYKEAAEMPTGYFEAKPERVVGFDEVAAAIIPSDLDEGLRAQLNEMGVKTVEYEAGNENARREALNGLEGVRFSRKADAAQEHDAMLKEMTGMTHDEMIAHDNAVEKQQAQNPARALAGRVVREYKSGIERSAVTSGFDAMMDAYQQHDDTKAQALADRLARDIIEKSVNLDRSHREQYQELINKLKTTGISLTDAQKQEVASQNDSYNAWRMRMFGSVKIKNDGTSLDAIWSELSDAAPEYFPADTNEAQMPEKLAAFAQAMRPKYVNPYGMDMDTAAADLSMRLQSDVLAVMRRKDESAQLKQSSDAMRESAAAQAAEEERSRRKKWQRESKALADAIYKAREAGDDQALQAALAEYRARRRRTMEGTAKADAAEIGMQIRRGRGEIARLNNLINQYEDQIKSDDVDRDRERLVDEKRQMVELREQLRQQVAHLHRQMTIDRARGQVDGLEAAVNNEARDADDVAADLELDSAMNEILNEDTVEEIDRIRGTVRSKAEALADQMRAQGMKDYNQTSTIPMEALTQFFGDLTGDLIRTSELAKVWKERRDRADAMRKGEQRELDVLKQQLKAARSEGDQEAIATLNDLVNKQQDRVDVLESQVKLAKAQAQYMSRIGAESMQQALREGRLPQPIMEYVMAMVRESGRSGRFNQNVLVKAVETMRENATFPIRVWDDLFGEYAPIMRAIYYDPVMDNETARQKWIASWRARIDELKLTAEESSLVQMYGEGVLPVDVEVSERVKQAAEVFRAFYDEAYVMANRAMERNGYGNVNRRSKYFPHMDIPKTFLERLGITEVNSGALPTMISGMTETFSPGHQYSAHLQARKGPTTDYDALEGFEDYIGAMSGVIFHTDDIQRHRQLESEIRTMAKVEGVNAQVDVHGQVYDHNHFVNWLHEYSNLLAGKKSQLDRGGEGTAGRALYKGLDLLRSTRGAGAVMGNISSAVSNAVPITQILAEHPLNTVQAAWLSMHNALHGRGNQPESQFRIRKFGSDSVVHTAYTKISHAAGKPFNFVDGIATDLVVNAYYLNNMSMGMDSETAMRSADSKAARLMGDRSTGAAPNIYSSKILGTFVTQFQLEVANQSQHFRKDIWREKNAGQAIVQLLMTAITGWVFNNMVEKVTGRRPAADPIEGVIEVVKTAMRGDGALSVVQAAFSNTSELFPYLGDGRVSGSAALEPALGAAESLFSGDGNEIRDAMVNLAFSHVPGGGQLNKIRRGAIALAKGGYYNASGKQLRFPVEATDPWVVTQALVFGPTSIEAAVDYYAGDAEGLSVAHTRNYEQARERGMTSTEAYENEATRAKAEKLQGAADKAADAAHAAERKRAAGIADTDMKDDIKNSDTSKVASQREEAKTLRSETVPTELIPDAYWDEREQPAMQNAIRIWQITGGDWVMPAVWEQDKKYTDDGEDYYIGPKVAEWANAEYKRQYDDLMSRVPDPDGLTEDQMAELKDALADIKSDISKQAKEAALYQQKGAE